MKLKDRKYQKELQETKRLMEVMNGIVNQSDLGDNWSAKYQQNKQQGKSPYTKQNYSVIPIPPNKTIQIDAIYLTEEQAAEINAAAEDVQLAMDTYNNILNQYS